MRLTVYLAGEIHSSWREEVKLKVAALNLPIDFVGPMEDHDRSDNIGEEILGKQPDAIFKDAAASSFNNLRTELLMKKADLGHRPFRGEIQAMEHSDGCQCRRRIRQTTDSHSQRRTSPCTERTIP